MVFAFANILMFLFDIFLTSRINHEYFPNTVKPLSALTLPQGHQHSLAPGCLLYFSGIFLCVAFGDNYIEFCFQKVDSGASIQRQQVSVVNATHQICL